MINGSSPNYFKGRKFCRYKLFEISRIFWSFAKLYTREILVFSTFAKVYTRKIFQTFELTKFSENLRIVKVSLTLKLCLYFYCLIYHRWERIFLFVSMVNLIWNSNRKSLYPLNVFDQQFAKVNPCETQFWLWSFAKVYTRESLYPRMFLPIK